MKRKLYRFAALTIVIVLLTTFINTDSINASINSKYPWVHVTIQKETNRTESKDWIKALDEALDTLPSHIVTGIKSENGLNVTLTVESNEKWSGRAYPDLTTGIYFNEQPSSKNYPLDSEPPILNGFSHNEKFYVALHELGHIYFFRSEKDTHDFQTFEKIVSTKNAEGEISWLEEPSTIYPLSHKANQLAESAAEAFALFVVSPDILKACYPLHYNFMRKLFDREYTETPNSIITRINCKQ